MHYTQNKHRKTYTPEFKLQCVNDYLTEQVNLPAPFVMNLV